MKRKLYTLALVALVMSGLSSCTGNMIARNYGGSTTIDLPVGQKLVNITWKEDDAWYLTKPMTAADSAVTSTFHESSSFGILNGTITVVEHKN